MRCTSVPRLAVRAAVGCAAAKAEAAKAEAVNVRVCLSLLVTVYLEAGAKSDAAACWAAAHREELACAALQRGRVPQDG